MPLDISGRRVNPWTVLVVLALGMFMTLLDLTIVNIAIPSLVDGIGASLDQVLWVLNAYSLAYAVLLITSGRLGDVVGPRTLFVAGLLVFTAASALSGLAQHPAELIAARAAQGAGAALLAPQSMAILLTVFPPERRGPVFAVFGILAGVAVVAGPTVGGFLVSSAGWRWIFFVNIPVGIAVVIAALRLVPDVRPGRRHRLDLAGVALATAGLFCVVFGLIEGQRYDWGPVRGFLTIPEIIGAGLVLLLAFLVNQARRQGREPLLPFAVFRDRNFTIMALVLCAMGFAVVGLYLPLTIYYQSVLGLSAIAAGLTVAVQPVAMLLSSGFASSPAGERLGAKRLLVLGLLLLAAGSAFIAWIAHASSARWDFVPGLIVSGIGMGFIWTPVFDLATHDLRPDLAGVASGVLDTIQELGAVIASAAVGALLQNRLATALHDRAAASAGQLPADLRGHFVDAFSGAAGSGLEVGAGQSGGTVTPPPGLPEQVAAQLQQLAHGVFTHAFVNAMRPTLVLPIAVIVLAALIATAARGRVRPVAESETGAASGPAEAEPEAAGVR
jgi:EmrB/QacA subfamily drug resistance transporter